MDLNYSPEDRAFRDKTRKWLEANKPTDDLKTLADREAWHRKLYDAGYIGLLWPREHGGAGRTPMQQASVQDEMARTGAPPAAHRLGVGLIGPAIIVHAPEAHNHRY